MNKAKINQFVLEALRENEQVLYLLEKCWILASPEKVTVRAII